jgi:hypothetical protein
MKTDIGRALPPSRVRAAVAVGLLAVTVDLWVLWRDYYPENIDGRWAVALTTLAAHFWLAGGDLPTVEWEKVGVGKGVRNQFGGRIGS